MNRKYNWLLDIIEGNRNDLLALTVRFGLYLVSIVYRLGIHFRNWAYNKQIFETHQIDLPVISIGNLTVGGTGKTPIVIWLAKFLNDNYNVAILSRGYGANEGELNDEGQEIRQRVSNVIQIQNPDRVDGARKFQSSHPNDPAKPSVAIMDDGFQHRRLKRDLDIVLIDATAPFGSRYVLPRGFLREPLTSIQRADVAVLNRANMVSESTRNSIKMKFKSLNPKLIWAETQLIPEEWNGLEGSTLPLDKLKGKRLFGFCGIGNPKNFFDSLKANSYSVVEAHVFPDHHSYSNTEIKKVVNAAIDSNCDAIVCTRKDLVKIDREFQPQIPIYALTTEISFVSGEREFVASVNATIESGKSQATQNGGTASS